MLYVVINDDDGDVYGIADSISVWADDVCENHEEYSDLRHEIKTEDYGVIIEFFDLDYDPITDSDVKIYRESYTAYPLPINKYEGI